MWISQSGKRGFPYKRAAPKKPAGCGGSPAGFATGEFSFSSLFSADFPPPGYRPGKFYLKTSHRHMGTAYRGCSTAVKPKET